MPKIHDKSPLSYHFCMLAQASLLERSFDDSIENCFRAIKCAPSNWRGYYLLALNLYEIGNYEDLLALSEQAIVFFEDRTEIQWVYIRVLILYGKLDKAQKMLNIYFDRNRDPMLEAEQIYLYLVSGDKDKAFTAIDDYLAKNKNSNIVDSFKYITVNNILCRVHSLFNTRINENKVICVISRKDQYNEILYLCKKAVSLIDNERTRSYLNYVKSFGRYVFNLRHKNKIALLIAAAVFIAYTKGVDIKSIAVSAFFIVVYLLFCFQKAYSLEMEAVTQLEPDRFMLISELSKFSGALESSDFCEAIFDSENESLR